MFIDTHCHLDLVLKESFGTLLSDDQVSATQKIIHEAAQHNVTTIITIGTTIIDSKNCILLAQRYASCYAVIGLHPNDCKATWHNDLEQIILLLKKKDQYKIVGIGECGIDLHYPNSDLKQQEDVFKAQIEVALAHDLPLVIHTRDAAQETLAILELYKNEPLKGVIHCFSQDESFAEKVLARGLYLGIGGTITYPKNTKLCSIVKKTPLHRILLETDAPFLAPQQVRGKKNHPKYIPLIAQHIAQLFGISLEEVAKQTTNNAKKLFNLP